MPVMKDEDAMFELAVQQLEAAQDAALSNPDTPSAQPSAKQQIVGDKNDRHNLPADDPLAWLPPPLDGDVPEGLEEFARQERAAEATGGMVQFDGAALDAPAGGGFSLLRDDMMLLGIRGDQVCNVHACTRVCVCVCVCVCACIYDVYAYTCMYVYAHTWIHVRISMYSDLARTHVREASMRG